MSNSVEDLPSTSTPLKKLELALQKEAATGKNKVDADFKEAYLLIEQHLENKVPQRVILNSFNAAYGYKLHPPRLRKMLLEERKRREVDGDVAICSACGQCLPSSRVGESTNDVEEQ